MAEFSYKAKEDSGKIISSTINALSKEEAVEKLCQKGLYPILVEEVVRSVRRTDVKLSSLDGMTMRKHVTVFARQMANLLKSGISVLRGLALMSEEHTNARFRAILNNIYLDIKDGKSLSQAIGAYPVIFDAFFVSMVKVGEDNGTLPENFARLVNHRKRQDDIRGKIKSALIYPAIIAIVGFFSLLYVMTSVLPKLIGIIDQLNIQKPAATVMLIAIVNFLKQYAIFVLAGIFIVYMAIVGVYKSEKGRLVLDKFKLSIPVYGSLVLRSEIATFADTLRASLDSGLQILRSLELALSVLDNTEIKRELNRSYQDIKNGMTLGESLKKMYIIPPMTSGMVIVGEESGRLSVTLAQISEDYESQVNDSVRTLMTLIEPVIIIGLGILIGFIVIALLLPIFSMDITSG